MKQIKLIIIILFFCALNSLEGYSQSASCTSSSPGSHSSCYVNSTSSYEFASDEWAFTCPTGNMHYYVEVQTDGGQYSYAGADAWGDLPSLSAYAWNQDTYNIDHEYVSGLNPNQTYYMGGTVTTQYGAYAYVSISAW